MNDRFLKARKYVVLALFLLFCVLSLIAMRLVVINYNISDYLNEKTETKISLDIIANEFGAASDVQVMVRDVTVDEALEICDTIRNIKDVVNVNFDEKSENYYKDGNALFVVLVNGDEYSSVANGVAAEIQSAIDEKYEGDTVYGGAVVEKSALRRSIQAEIVLILVISVLLAALIMLITSRSWLEPVILLAASGVAILINMGTNAIFGEISYITNAVAAILQLALSVDYSIVLLHHYRAVRPEMPDSERAMTKAIIEVIKPVSASALTTIAGLLALLFMSFRIGFDIGIVLMKGIVISAITSLTLFPAFLLLFEKLMNKTKKPELAIGGKLFANISHKAGKFIIPVALAAVIVCGALQPLNTYIFTDTKNVNSAIGDTFGKNNTVLVLYPQTDDGFDRELQLKEKLEEFKNSAGEGVLKSFTAYSNTVREVYDVKKASEKLGIPEEDVELLLSMYHLSGNPSLVRLDTMEFVRFADELMATDEDAKAFTDESTVKTMAMLLAIERVMNGEHTAEEFFTLATTGALEGTPLELFSIEQMYGLYFFDDVSANDRRINIETMIDYMADIASKEENRDLFDADIAAKLSELSSGIEELKAQESMLKSMEKQMSQSAFRTYMRDNYGVRLTALETGVIFTNYCTQKGIASQDKIRLDELLIFLSETQSGSFTAEALEMIGQYKAHADGYRAALAQLKNSYEYGGFISGMSALVQNLTGETLELGISDLAIQQIYIMYLYDNGKMPDGKISGREFVDFINETYPKNPVISEKLSDEGKLKLADICVVDEFLLDTESYGYKTMTEKLNSLKDSVQSMTAEVALSEDKIMGVFVKYAAAKDLDIAEPVMAFEMLEFVSENVDKNEFLKSKMTDSHREKLDSAKDAMASAESMLIGSAHNRILLSVNLPAESEDSSRFVEFLTASVKGIFGNEAHVAGETVSTHDLKVTFAADNTLISVFTIVSIFLIIMAVFRSLSLPVVLVAVIQGAIWITMSAAVAMTGPMFFMSYIMASCILMGATIDYGILMSTNYVDYRLMLDKKEALKKALDAAMPTVFTSGLILTVCGFVVGAIASQNSISTVGILLGMGTLISVFMITLVLPALLYYLDPFIMKLTIKSKKKVKPEQE